MRKTVFKAICINEYVKNIRLHSFAPTFAIFPQNIFLKISLVFTPKYNRVLKVEDYQSKIKKPHEPQKR